MSSRQSEIEAKRARIAELKRQREEKRSRQTAALGGSSIDDLVNSLVGSRVSTTESINSSGGAASTIPTPSTPISGVGRPSSSRGASALSHYSDVRSNSPAISEPCSTSKSAFTVFPVFDVPPVRKAAGSAGGSAAVVTYSKEVQTSPYEDDGNDEDDYGAEEVVYKGSELELLRNSIRQEIEAEIARASRGKDTQQQQRQDAGESEKQVIDNIEITLAEDSELDQLATDPAFDQFLDQSLKVVGRAVAATHRYDITIDYRTAVDGNTAAQLGDRRRPVVELAQFHSPYSVGRAVTALDWSPHFPELLASAHTEKRGDSHAPKGLVQIWNLNGSPSQPEYVFTAASDVLAVKFSQFDAHVLFGTCYNGQVLTWDLRRLRRGGSGTNAKSASGEAVLASPVNGHGHAHPVYSVEVTGTQNAHNLVTASTDGLVCTWTPDLLEQPQDKLVLMALPPGLPGGMGSTVGGGGSMTSAGTSVRNDEIAPTRLAISPRDSSRFVVGTEEGALYQCSRFGQAGSRAGVDPRGAYRAHAAPVTALEFHSPRGAVDFSDLLLSSSLDWSVKLWKIRPFTGPLAVGAGGKTDLNSLEPLLDLVRDHEVYDVAWSGFHPAVFASVDGSGHLELWDLARDIEVPIARVKPSSSASAATTSSTKLSFNDSYLERPLNRVAWEKTAGTPLAASATTVVTEIDGSNSINNVDDESPASGGGSGRRVVVGGLDGHVTVFELDSEIFASPRPADWVEIEKRLAQLERIGGAGTLF
ncbi:hypothetical protein D0Z00_001005 [Geotrichum galactomycetum]|uniref:Uncharacterized protein n=1 Tax=Geotrichum galactomycetum TaxID=27317 RepID=A0ACB6V885_9ASCO|nr:hypothetical protein D0Z00_001005 [Geotrichum candidum]